MTFEQIIQVGGIAICLWEIAKIWLAKFQREDEYIPSPPSRVPLRPGYIETKEAFFDYLRNEWYDREFTLSDVCPENWTKQKCAAAMVYLRSYGKINRKEENGKFWYKISLDKWENLW